MQRYFVTGIGTEVGKTVAAAIITEALKADYWKPVQAGDVNYSDTHKVKDYISNSKTKFHPNAYLLNTPMSPHAAAAIDGVQISAKSVITPQSTNEKLVVEGAGGLLVPINDTETITDLMVKTDKVILVSRHYLGSINHTLLSIELLKQRGFSQVGILFNGEAHPTTEEIITTMSGVTILGRIEALAELTKEAIRDEAKKIKPALLSF